MENKDTKLSVLSRAYWETNPKDLIEQLSLLPEGFKVVHNRHGIPALTIIDDKGRYAGYIEFKHTGAFTTWLTGEEIDMWEEHNNAIQKTSD